ncbi:MAG: trigger factor [Candidatus Saganbacteria bacterium]|nr:trigger factor [Candidatus Saganbacteria bacterium]
MKILKQEREGNKVKLEVELPYSLLEAEKNKAFNEVAAEISIPGFRKGKAPRAVLERNINKDAVTDRAVQNLIQDNYPKVIDEVKIEPVDFPEVNVLRQEEGKPFAFSVSVDVYPEVKLGKYKGIEAKKKDTAVTDNEVENFIKDLQDRFAKLKEVISRGIENDDLVMLDLEASSEGKGIKALSRKGVAISIGKGQITPEFDSELMGLSTGSEKEFKLKMPTDHPIQEAAGKEVLFKVKPIRIAEKELPALDQEFVGKFSTAGSPEKFREETKKRLTEEKIRTAEEEVKNEVVEKVIEEANVEIPDGMIRRETDLMVDELRHSLLREKLTLDDYLKSVKKNEEKLREELKGGATKRVLAKITLRAVSEKENIKVEEEDLGIEIAALAKEEGGEAGEFKEKIGESGKEYIKDYLLRRKALDFLVTKAKIR